MLKSLFRALTDRFKAMFATNAALDLEAEFFARDAQRRAELLRQADGYEREGLTGVAEGLRRQVHSLGVQQPLASVLPALGHLKSDDSADELACLIVKTPTVGRLTHVRKEKGGRS
jgi:hypothetical protein